MYKKRIMNPGELDVDSILDRNLSQEGFQVHQKVRLQSVIGKDNSLSERDFDYYRMSEFDFLVTKDNLPIFAVEFDGKRHFDDPETVERDVIKNRLCKEADLPLLRIRPSEVEEQDKITLLDYMLGCYVAWEKEYPQIIEELNERASTLPPDFDPEDYAVDFDPAVEFDLNRPFPDLDAVVKRLWENHRIAKSTGRPEHRQTAKYLCHVTQAREGPSENEQFLRCTSRVQVWKPYSEATLIYSDEVVVNLRAWLPLHNHIPNPDVFRLFWDPNQDAKEILKQFKNRVESMWFPNFPGMHPWDIAENYANYLGFRMVEQWAKSELL